MATKLVVLSLVWAITATALFCFRPDLSVAVSNWILQRESMQGRVFLTQTQGPEVLVAYGNERYIFCARACEVEEIGENGAQGIYMCDSQWEGRKHICTARLWPGRHYIVSTPRARHTGVR